MLRHEVQVEIKKPSVTFNDLREGAIWKSSAEGDWYMKIETMTGPGGCVVNCIRLFDGAHGRALTDVDTTIIVADNGTKITITAGYH